MEMSLPLAVKWQNFHSLQAFPGLLFSRPVLVVQTWYLQWLPCCPWKMFLLHQEEKRMYQQPQRLIRTLLNKLAGLTTLLRFCMSTDNAIQGWFNCKKKKTNLANFIFWQRETSKTRLFCRPYKQNYFLRSVARRLHAGVGNITFTGEHWKWRTTFIVNWKPFYKDKWV